MDANELAVMIPIFAVLGGVGLIMYLRKMENTERMAMIEKGVSPEFFNIKKHRSTSGPLRAALLFIGVGLGLFTGYFLDSAFGMDEVGYFAMLFILGGTGLGIAYVVEEKKQKEENRR